MKKNIKKVHHILVKTFAEEKSCVSNEISVVAVLVSVMKYKIASSDF
jgi:hypothetical protein